MKDIPIAFIDDETLYESENFVDFKLQEKDKETKRLNNIINNIEKWLQEEIKSTKEKIKVCDDEEDRGIYLDKVYNYKDVLDKLQELKGSDKE